MISATVFITPSLLVGTHRPLHIKVEVCDDAEAAALLIARGGTALVSSLREARETLRLLGTSEEQIERNIRYATGNFSQETDERIAL